MSAPADIDDNKGQHERLMLEDAPAGDREGVHTLDLSSGQASISLGPVVVNEDGTLARISNWAKMTDGEQKTTLRVLTKRNAARLKTLREKDGQSAEEVAREVQGTNDVVKEALQEKNIAEHKEL